MWADRAHRVTTLGLIGLSLVTLVLATGGITDMVLHNRRKRNEWFAEMQMKSAKELGEARRAQSLGSATEDQVLLINRERAAYEAAEARKNKPGVFKSATTWLFSGLSSEEQKGGRLGGGTTASAAATQPEAVNAFPQPAIAGQEHDRSVLQAVQDKVEANRRQGERVEERIRPMGGPLDRQAANAANAATDVGRGWMSWMVEK